MGNGDKSGVQPGQFDTICYANHSATYLYKRSSEYNGLALYFLLCTLYMDCYYVLPNYNYLAL